MSKSKETRKETKKQPKAKESEAGKKVPRYMREDGVSSTTQRAAK